MTQEQFYQMDVNQVSKVYSGKDNCCRCGCKGTYTYTSFAKDSRSLVNDKKVKSSLTRAKNMLRANEAEFEDGGNHVNVSYGNDRALTFYTDELK